MNIAKAILRILLAVDYDGLQSCWPFSHWRDRLRRHRMRPCDVIARIIECNKGELQHLLTFIKFRIDFRPSSGPQMGHESMIMN